MYKNLKNNLSAQVLKKVFLFYLIIAITLTTIQMIITFQSTKQDVKDTLKSFKITFAPSLKNAIWDMQDKQTKNLLDGLVKSNSVVSVQIVDINDKKLYESGIIINKKKLSKNTFFEEFNLIHNDIFIGKVIIYSNTFVVFNKVKNDFLVLIINAILKTVALWFLMLWISKELISRPLKILTDELEHMDLDNLKHHKLFLNLKQQNELTIVEHTFNKMVIKLRNTYYKIDMLNKTLENKVKERTQALESTNKDLKRMENTDSMTNAYNRRYFFNISKNLLSLMNREKNNLSVLIIDIDKFKNINDKYGHDTGDKVIIKLVNIISDIIRSSDILSRFSGEEFAIMFPNTAISGVEIVAQKIRKKFENTTILNNINFTVSIGISEIKNGENNIEPALKRANDALFIAKDTGRNKVVVYKEN